MTLPATPFRVRDLRDVLPPDAIIRALEITAGGAYLIAEMPDQLVLFENAQGPPHAGTGLWAPSGISCQEEAANTSIIAYPADTAVAS